MKKRVFFAFIVIVSIIMILSFPVLAFADQLGKVDAGGNRILTIIRRIGYWIILIKGIADVIKAGMNGDNNGIGKIIFTYVLIYGTLFFLPWALRLVEGVF